MENCLPVGYSGSVIIALEAALLRAADVCAFLIGIMALAELARHEGLFDWLASHALRIGGGSQPRLFALMYVVGVAVTALLSNDTTAVVLTPAVAAALRRTDAPPLPYLFICAFVANAASYVLPISNPANLVLFGRQLPALHIWLGTLGVSAIAAMVLTYVGLRIAFRGSLQTNYGEHRAPAPLPPGAGFSGAAIALAALALLIASALQLDIGAAALLGALVCLGLVTLRERGAAWFVARHIAWQVVPLVVGLFALVAVIDNAGMLHLLRGYLQHGDRLAIALVITVASNVVNNLPVALATGFALQSAPVTPTIAHAALVAVDLGPNISVTGSLATMLWLIALRRERFQVSAWHFLRIGVAITVPTLTVAVLLAR